MMRTPTYKRELPGASVRLSTANYDSQLQAPMAGCSCCAFSPARARLSFLLLLLLFPFLAWDSTGFFPLLPPGADAADLPDASSLCAAKCGTCPVVCETPPPPQSSAIRQLPAPPPPKKSGQPPPATPSPPAGGQRGLSSPYYYFYTSSAAPRGLPSLAATECLMLLLLLVSGFVVFFR